MSQASTEDAESQKSSGDQPTQLVPVLMTTSPKAPKEIFSRHWNPKVPERYLSEHSHHSALSRARLENRHHSLDGSPLRSSLSTPTRVTISSSPVSHTGDKLQHSKAYSGDCTLGGRYPLQPPRAGNE